LVALGQFNGNYWPLPYYSYFQVVAYDSGNHLTGRRTTVGMSVLFPPVNNLFITAEVIRESVKTSIKLNGYLFPRA
jgi:hypothetical protein